MMASVGDPKLKSLMTPLVATAGALGFIQGLGWSLCSIGGILFHTDVIAITPSYGNDTIGNRIYFTYLSSNPRKPDNIIIGSNEFSYFLYIYLALSFSWLLISSVLLWASITGKGEKFYGKAIGGWTLFVGLVSLLDLILVCLISHDYARSSSTHHPLLLPAMGVVMTLAARGFVLWIINVTFAIILGKYCHKMYKKDAGSQNRAPIDAYASGPVPWLDPSLYNDNSTGYDNKSYKDDDNSSSVANFMEDRDANANRINNNRINNAREFPQVNLKKPNGTSNYWNNRNQQNKPNSRPYSEADLISPYGQTQLSPARTAKIGRPPGQRSPPLNVAPPFIPDPDYSPPGTPKVRGVLRPKSNYANFNMY